jgi:DNA-binding MarR family transcriptional regulator
MELPWPRPVLRLTEEEAVLDAALRIYQRGARFRRGCEAELRGFGISFPLWWVLAVTDRVIRETDAEVSQRAVCRRVELSKSTVSYLMRSLRERRLIEREPDEWLADCILLTERGEGLLAAVRGGVVRAAQRAISER